jgi:hypothetical protein
VEQISLLVPVSRAGSGLRRSLRKVVLIRLRGLGIRPKEFEVLAEVNIKITVFWDVEPFSLVVWFRCLGRTCYLHLQGERGAFKSIVSESRISRSRSYMFHYFVRKRKFTVA